MIVVIEVLVVGWKSRAEGLQMRPRIIRPWRRSKSFTGWSLQSRRTFFSHLSRSSASVCVCVCVAVRRFVSCSKGSHRELISRTQASSTLGF